MHGSFLRGSRHGSAHGSRTGSRHGSRHGSARSSRNSSRHGKRNNTGPDGKTVAAPGIEHVTSNGTATRGQTLPVKDLCALDTTEQKLVTEAEGERTDPTGVGESRGLQRGELVAIRGAVADGQAEVTARTDTVRTSLETGPGSPVARKPEQALESEPGESGQVMRPSIPLAAETNVAISAGADLATTDGESMQEGLAGTSGHDAPTYMEANDVVELRIVKVDTTVNKDSQHETVAEAPAGGDERKTEAFVAGQEQSDQVHFVPMTLPDRASQAKVVYVWQPL